MKHIKQLKVNVKSLAAEAAIIRKEEKKLRKQIKANVVKDSATVDRLRRIRNSLNDHRRCLLRHEARTANLAYAFLRGKAYRDVEPNVYDTTSWIYLSLPRRVAQKANRFENKLFDEKDIREWMQRKT